MVSDIFRWVGQLTTVPNLELTAIHLLLNHHLGWPTGGLVRKKYPRRIHRCQWGRWRTKNYDDWMSIDLATKTAQFGMWLIPIGISQIPTRWSYSTNLSPQRNTNLLGASFPTNNIASENWRLENWMENHFIFGSRPIFICEFFWSVSFPLALLQNKNTKTNNCLIRQDPSPPQKKNCRTQLGQHFNGTPATISGSLPAN